MEKIVIMATVLKKSFKFALQKHNVTLNYSIRKNKQI